MIEPQRALASYPAMCTGPIAAEPRRGLSGGVCFHVDALGGLCLKLWPPETPRDKFLPVHPLLSQAERHHVEFVPRVQQTVAGDTWVQDHRLGRWDLTSWMPGQAAPIGACSKEKVRHACAALARLHLAFAKNPFPHLRTVPAVQRRLEVWADWRSLSERGWNPWQRLGRHVLPDRAWDLLCRWMPQVPRWLAPWQEAALTRQWCHGDPWRGNLLFTGDQLTGLIDFAAARLDSPAADLARLLGSLAQDDSNLWQAGEEAYAAIRPLSLHERALAPVLDRSGTLGALFHWIRWLTQHDEDEDRIKRGMERVQELVQRIEKWE